MRDFVQVIYVARIGDGGKSVRHALKPSTDSQEGVGHCQGHCPGHICSQNWKRQEKHGQWWKSTGNGGRSIRYSLNSSTDSQKSVGHF